MTGPEEAWNTVTKPITRSSGITLYPVDYSEIPVPTKIADIIKLDQNIIVFLPT